MAIAITAYHVQPQCDRLKVESDSILIKNNVSRFRSPLIQVILIGYRSPHKNQIVVDLRQFNLEQA